MRRVNPDFVTLEEFFFKKALGEALRNRRKEKGVKRIFNLELKHPKFTLKAKENEHMFSLRERSSEPHLLSFRQFVKYFSKLWNIYLYQSINQNSEYGMRLHFPYSLPSFSNRYIEKLKLNATPVSRAEGLLRYQKQTPPNFYINRNKSAGPYSG
jgi:hypothetical protein